MFTLCAGEPSVQ